MNRPDRSAPAPPVVPVDRALLHWVDSHCHLQTTHDDRADGDSLITRARDAGVEWMVCVGTDLETSRDAIAFAECNDDVFATVGLHPHDASRFGDEWDGLVALMRESDRVVGIGECGFDLHYRHSEPDAQERAFRSQIRAAHELDRCLVIHSREAWDDTFRVLADETVPRRTVFHCFTGGPAEAERALELGTNLSFSGIVSFKTADDLRAAAAITPPERMLVETDSPFLAPVPFRGKPNEPAFVAHVGAALAAATGIPVADLARITAENAHRLFPA